MLPPCEPTAIRDELRRILDALPEQTAAPSAGSADAPEAMSLSTLATALEEALDALAQRIHIDCSDAPVTEQPGLDRLGDHVIDLLDRLTQHARRLGADADAHDLDGLLLALACCVVRSGGELSLLQPVVNAAAERAKDERDPAQIRLLYHMADDVARGLSARFSGALPGSARFETWRALLINRAIIAMRTLEPQLMEPAFDALLEELPADAPTFFREGMRQMALMDYPRAVREVMRRYHDARGTDERLH
ncbi:MAG: hypothetical protein LJE69_02940 [Thiohalocapsa sp.]|uniref:hypothetical protein n=1 Tax=Thiohalocapsa sp. TaxID=2497641 RepID=UPI0025E9BA7C|nr:hypothetical protein [Thiohalocapsa sp.]MCG6940190.1 hypothetical protein [Thiohalocapsa sp.]